MLEPLQGIVAFPIAEGGQSVLVELFQLPSARFLKLVLVSDAIHSCCTPALCEDEGISRAARISPIHGRHYLGSPEHVALRKRRHERRLQATTSEAVAAHEVCVQHPRTRDLDQIPGR